MIDQGEPNKVTQCVAALDALDVPPTAGRDTAAAALRRDGQQFRNETIAAAVKARKEAVPT